MKLIFDEVIQSVYTATVLASSFYASLCKYMYVIPAIYQSPHLLDLPYQRS